MGCPAPSTEPPMQNTRYDADHDLLSPWGDVHAARALFRLSEALDAATTRRDQLTIADAVVFVIADLRRADSFTAQTRDRFATLWQRFVAFATAFGVTRVVEVTTDLVRTFVFAPTKDGRAPSPATTKLRRSAIRTLWRALRDVQLAVGDPTLDLDLEKGAARPTRPLTNDEVERCRWASLGTIVPSRLPALWALLEAGAATGEAPHVTFATVDEATSTVLLPGTRKLEARRVALTPWGLTQLQRRAREIGDASTPLVYAGERSEQSAQSSACRGVETIFKWAWIDDPMVRPSSVRAWVGQRVFVLTGRIEAVALELGLQSLDAAATVIGFGPERWER